MNGDYDGWNTLALTEGVVAMAQFRGMCFRDGFGARAEVRDKARIDLICEASESYVHGAVLQTPFLTDCFHSKGKSKNQVGRETEAYQPIAMT